MRFLKFMKNSAPFDFFALKIAAFNAFGFAATVVFVTYVDSMIPSHVKYGARSYKYGYWSALLSILILVSTFLFISKAKQNFLKYLGSVAPLLASGCIVITFVFQPEFPHAGTSQWIILYGGVTMITMWLHHIDTRPTFIADNRIAVPARIEAVKSQITIWQTLTIALVASYLAVVGLWTDKLWTNSAKVATADADIFLLATTQILQVGIFSLFVIFGPMKEGFARVIASSLLFSEIKEGKQ